MKLECDAFSDGAVIPREYGYKNGNKTPAIRITDAPKDARSLVLIMDDPDAQAAVGKTWVHWTAWNIPADAASPSGATEGTTDFGSMGYGGPAPPDREHTYVFTLYALDKMLDIPSGADRAELDSAMRGHIVGTTTLRGRYAP